MPLTVTNDELREEIGRFLGWSGDVRLLAANPVWAPAVERILKEGMRMFYDPDVLPGEEKHQWSFLKPTLAIDMAEGVWHYDLPPDFAMFTGPLNYQPDANALYCPIEIVGAEQVQYRIQQASSSGRPTIAAYRIKSDAGSETAYELIVHPAPNDSYRVMAPIKINPLAPSTALELPVGDQSHVQTLIEACLAAAEVFNKSGAVHQDRFAARLRSSVSHDRQVNCPPYLGKNLDRSDGYVDEMSWLRLHGGNLVTLNGMVVT